MESYKLVSRNYLNGLMNKSCEYLTCADCSYCSRLMSIRKELDKNNFDTFNKDVDCRKIIKASISLSMVPDLCLERPIESKLSSV